ncbi:MAG: biotin/lipoyl-binding protein [Pirellulaceae bacterium]
MFLHKLPHFQDFFAGRNWFLLAVVLAVTKVGHEFGHGLACKRFGGQCHEMGLMLLVFTPCLYANVSDGWMLPSKWKRILISAAGMYVELLMASLATFVWWFSEPGFVNQLALNVMFVCSVTTLLFNANPLMRYDGYYILSDWIEIPNLRQKASSLINQTLTNWLFEIEGKPDPFLPNRKRWLFVLYGVASVAYRWLITFSIFWFLYKVLEPYGLKVIGQMLAVTSLFGLLFGPVMAAKRFFTVPGRWAAVNRVRMATVGLVLVVLVMTVLSFPIPHYVNCTCYLQPTKSAAVYVQEPGTIDQIHVNHVQTVSVGDPLLTLSSRELDYRVAQLERK